MTDRRQFSRTLTGLTNLFSDDISDLGENFYTKTEVDTEISTAVSAHNDLTTGVHGVTGDVVGTTDEQTLEFKTLERPDIDDYAHLINDGGVLRFTWRDQTGPVSVAIVPDIGGGSHDFIMDDLAQAMTNKTIDASSNDITNIGNDELIGGIDAAKIGDGSVSNTEFEFLDGVSSQVVGTTDDVTLTNKTFGDTLDMDGNQIHNVDKVQASSGQDISIDAASGQDINLNIAGAGVVNIGPSLSVSSSAFSSLTNLFMNNNTISNAVLTSPTISDDLVFTGDTNDLTVTVSDQTLGDRTLTIPSLTTNDEVVLLNQTQTLSNKSFDTDVDLDLNNLNSVAEIHSGTGGELQLHGIGAGSDVDIYINGVQKFDVNETSNASLQDLSLANNDITGVSNIEFSTGTSELSKTSGDFEIRIGGALAIDIASTLISFFKRLDMGSNRITSVGTPTSASDAATKDYVDTEISGVALGSYLQKSGDTMSGTLNMDSNFITNLPTPTASGHAATYDYVRSVYHSVVFTRANVSSSTNHFLSSYGPTGAGYPQRFWCRHDLQLRGCMIQFDSEASSWSTGTLDVLFYSGGSGSNSGTLLYTAALTSGSLNLLNNGESDDNSTSWSEYVVSFDYPSDQIDANDHVSVKVDASGTNISGVELYVHLYYTQR